MELPYLTKDIEKNGKKGLEIRVHTSWEELYFSNAPIASKMNYDFIDVHFTESIRFSSAGIIDWMRFYKSLGDVPFYFYECSYGVMSYANLFPTFFPKNSSIESFFIPYYDQEGDQSRNVLVIRGKDYDNNGILRLPQVKNEKGDLLEVDVSPEKYFKILKKS